VSEFPVEGRRESEAVRPASDFSYQEPAYRSWDEDEEGLDLRRVFAAIARRKLLVFVCLLLGAAASVVAWNIVPVSYTARGVLSVDVETGPNSGGVTPIQQPELFETTAYLELFETSAVLLPVVLDRRMYLSTPPENRPFFETLGLDEERGFVPGNYTVTVLPEGGWQLEHATLGVVGSGAFGEPMGEEVGLVFTPARGDLADGAEIEFTLRPPFEVERSLAESLVKSTTGRGNFIDVTYSGVNPERITEVLNAVLENHISVATQLNRSRLDELQIALEEQLVAAETRLANAERALEDFRVETVVLPSDQATPIAPGLEMTRDPVFGNFFQMQTNLEEVRRDRSRISEVLQALPDTTLPVESLESIPSAAASRELQQVLDEVVTLRSDLRLLRGRYSDDYPPTQEVLARLRTLSEEAVPRILAGIVRELDTQEAQLEALIADASSELSEIPVRSIRETQLRRDVLTQENIYNDLRSRVENARLAATASAVADVRILDRAVVPTEPSDDTRFLYAGGMLLGGLLLGIGGALLLDRTDGRVRYPTQVDGEIGLNILGNIPRVQNPGRFGHKDDNHAAVLESFRELRIATSFAFGSAGPLTLAITSPSAGEGKTFVSVNLAYAFAELGRRTILIDGDTRRGDAHRMLGIERTPGLTDYLPNGAADEVIRSTSHEFLSYIPSGSRAGNTPELLASNRMAQFLGALKRAYDVVIVDCPPLTGGGDALVLSNLTGNMAMVLRSGTTDRKLAADRVEALSRFPFRILGAILNDTAPDGFYGYYSTYLPSYLTAADGDEDESRLVMPGSGEGSTDRE